MKNLKAISVLALSLGIFLAGCAGSEGPQGDSVTVSALDGDIQLSLPAGTQPGDVKLFRGRGMPALRGRGRGSLKVIVQVTVPRHLSAEQRELLERFQELCSEKNYEPGDGFFDRVRAAFRP